MSECRPLHELRNTNREVRYLNKNSQGAHIVGVNRLHFLLLLRQNSLSLDRH